MPPDLQAALRKTRAHLDIGQGSQGFDTRAAFEARLQAAGFADVRGQDLFPGGLASLVEAR